MEITLPVFTGLTAATILVLQLFLMFRVGLARGRAQLPLGYGDDPDTLRIIRRHANLAENSGLFIAALALLEMLGGAPYAVIGLGAVFVVARIAHAIGMSAKETVNPGRVIGALGTVGSGLGIGGYLAYVAASTL